MSDMNELPFFNDDNANSSDDYNKGKEDGIKEGFEQGVASVPNPLEYVSGLDYAFQQAAFPENYELILYVPNVRTLQYLLFSATGLKKLTIKGNTNGNTINFSHSIRANATLEVVDLSGFNAKFSYSNYAFMGDKLLKEIKGEIDLTECTTVVHMFASCNALEEVRFKTNSIKLSLNFGNCSKLSVETVQSIIDGLATVETQQTLTLNGIVSSALTQEQMAQIIEKNWSVE